MAHVDTGPEVAQRIARLLKEKSLKQKDLAAQAQIPQSTISNLMVGSIKEPYASTVYKIAQVLDTTVEDLLEGIVTIEPPTGLELEGLDPVLARKIAELVRAHHAGDGQGQKAPRRTGAPSARRKKS